MSIGSPRAKRLVSASLLTYLLIAAGLPWDQDRVRARGSYHKLAIASAPGQMVGIARQPNRVRSLNFHWRGSTALSALTPSALLLLRCGSPADVAFLYLQFLSGLLLLGRSPPSRPL